MKLLFIFLDGVGLGKDDPEFNPFARLCTTRLDELLEGHKLISNGHVSAGEAGLYLSDNKLTSLLALDARMGIEGVPQSATGQASLFTGINVPGWLGYHEGPKPTPPIISLINRSSLFTQLRLKGRSVSLLNAFPPRYFESIDAGYRIPGTIAMAVKQAGFQLKTLDDLYAGNALSADFTAQGWRNHLGFIDAPVLSNAQAGARLAELAETADLAIFEYWLTDLAGHHQDMSSACDLLLALDEVIGSLLKNWDYQNHLILLTSDHGNLEDISTRHHTLNDVPLLIIGAAQLRYTFIEQLKHAASPKSRLDLTTLTPAILNFLG